MGGSVLEALMCSKPHRCLRTSGAAGGPAGGPEPGFALVRQIEDILSTLFFSV